MARTVRLWSTLLNKPVVANLVETFEIILIRKNIIFDHIASNLSKFSTENKLNYQPFSCGR